MPGTLDIKDLELNALLEVTQAINNNLPAQDLYRIYKFTLLGDLKVKRMALFVRDGGWLCQVFFGTSQNWDGKTIQDELLSIKSVTELNDDYPDFEQAIPVFHNDKLLAVVLVGGGDAGFAQRESSAFLQALTNIMVVAIENKRLAKQQLEQEAYRRELEIAKKVQNFLFPKSLPKTKKLNIEAVYLPHHDVGGDYYDYLAIDNDRFLVCVADVSGKGVPAALLMSNFQASLRTLVRKTLDPKEIVEELNHAIYNSGNAENFITFFLGIYDFKTCSFEYINCGHNPQYLISGEKLMEMNEGTTILGMFDPLPFIETKKITDLKDFFFFGYTDGLTETFDAAGEQYGEERVKQLLMSQDKTNLQTFHEALFRSLDEFRQDVSYKDDITMLSCMVSNK